MIRRVGRIFLYSLAIILVLFFIAGFLFSGKVIKDPAGFLQGTIVASTALIGFTGIFLTSRMFEQVRLVRILRLSRNFFLLSIFLGISVVGFSLAWFTGFLVDPYLNPETFTPKIVEVLFLGQLLFVWIGFVLKYFTGRS